MSFDFVRLLLCYRAEEKPGGRREACLVLNFEMNITKVEIAIRVVQFWCEIKDFRRDCTPQSAITIIYIECQGSFILVSYWVKEDHVTVAKFNC